jgi:archaellum biogenesis ATPase FlaH
MSFSLKLESDGEHGTFHDHNPNADPQSGSLYDLAKLLNIPIPSLTPVASTKRKYEGIHDYAVAHGVMGDTLREWQWRETTHQDRPALEFPTQSGLRWRFLDGAKDKPTYTSAGGYKRCWYGLSKALMAMLEDGKPLVICNGEISTIAGRYWGVASLAMTSGEKGEIPAELMEQLKGFVGSLKVKVIIALDCDKPGRAAARGLEKQFRDEGFDARAVDLGLGLGGDLADFCRLHTEDAKIKLLDLPGLPVVADSSKWTFATIDDLLRMNPIDWLVPRQIPARGLTMLFGASGTYKSFFILDHAMRLAHEGVNVLYIAAEGEHGYRQRVEAWIQHHGIKPRAITFVLGQVDLFDVEERDEFARLIEIYKPKLVVVDTFAMCSGLADENAARDMLQIVNGCKTMSRNLDAVIVVVHHTNAEGKKERGSKVLRNACDTIIRVSLEDDRVMVDSQKTKDTKAFEPYYLVPVSVPLGYRNNIGEDVTSVVLLASEKVILGDDLTPLQRRVLLHLAVEPDATLAEIADAVESDNRGTIGNVISKLIKRGYVSMSGGSRYVSDKGHQALDSTDSTDSGDSTRLNNGESQKWVESVESPESVESVATLPGIDQTTLIGKGKKRRNQYESWA